MDLLCTPDDPSSATPRGLYLCTETWDGGPFRSYASRKGCVSRIPIHLRQDACDPDSPASYEPYLEGLYPTKQEELEPFLQTWLFFGLAAEFLGLNETVPGVRRIDDDTAVKGIEKLHESCVEVDHEDGAKYLTGLPILERLQNNIAKSVQSGAPPKDRLIYLSECLKFASFLLNSFQDNLDDRIRCPIAALGEILTLGLFRFASLLQPGISLSATACNWYPNYARAGGAVEGRMLESGWCPSMIEKLRSQSNGLITMHYTSCLKLAREQQVDHSRCNVRICQSFQIRLEEYHPRHVSTGCQCGDLLEIDESELGTILEQSDSFPVLRVHGLDNANYSDLRIEIETWKPGMPYVALSHVWADGLGNPRMTALPRCQVARLSRLIAGLQKTAQEQPGSDENRPPYYLWVDTLCCPINLKLKNIALQRIARVYSEAAHVLVLETTLTSQKAEGVHPAELMLRSFGISPWMRRLWTLQEGSLSRSLYFQFADVAVAANNLLEKLFGTALADVRYLRVFNDVTNEFNPIQGLFFKRSVEAEARKISVSHQLISLQRALQFRTVSVESDEPLCIATLMGLDMNHITSVTGLEERMARVWEQMAKLNGGVLSSRILFLLEDPIDIPGWRWAPRSFLESSSRQSWLTIDDRAVRFAQANTFTETPVLSATVGIPTPLGLQVTVKGVLLNPKPRLAGLSLHPWPDIANPAEDGILLRDEAGNWLRILDHYRSRKLATWTHKQKVEHDRKANNPLCRAIDTGKCALIFDPQTKEGDSYVLSCMLQVDEADEKDREMLNLKDHPGKIWKGRRGRAVILAKLESSEVVMMDILVKLADEIASNQVTQDLLAIEDRTTGAFKKASKKVRQYMKDIMKQAWEKDVALRQSVEDHIGKDLEEYLWSVIPKSFSHDTTIKPLADEQIWLVD